MRRLYGMPWAAVYFSLSMSLSLSNIGIVVCISVTVVVNVTVAVPPPVARTSLIYISPASGTLLFLFPVHSLGFNGAHLLSHFPEVYLPVSFPRHSADMHPLWHALL